MATKVLLKKSAVADKVPTTSDLEYGELAINYADGKLYYKNSNNAIDEFVSASATVSGVVSIGGVTGAISSQQLLDLINQIDGSTFNVLSRVGEVQVILTSLLLNYLNFDTKTFRTPVGLVDTRATTITVTG
jgi:hypothetical protein